MPTSQIRQGDVLVEAIDRVPAHGMTVVPRDGGLVVLAYGEATGHAHVIRSPSVRLLEGGGHRYLEVGTEAVLEHEEHAAIPLLPGTYRVVLQREYLPPEPFAELTPNRWRTVTD